MEGRGGKRWPYVSADDIPEQAEIHLLRQLRRRQRRSALLGSSWTLPAVALCGGIHRCSSLLPPPCPVIAVSQSAAVIFRGIPGEEPRSHRGALDTSSHTRARCCRLHFLGVGGGGGGGGGDDGDDANLRASVQRFCLFLTLVPVTPALIIRAGDAPSWRQSVSRSVLTAVALDGAAAAAQSSDDPDAHAHHSPPRFS